MREKDSIARRWRPLVGREVAPGSADRMLSSAGGLCGLPPQLLPPLRRSLLCRGIWMGGSSFGRISTRAIAPTGELLDASGRVTGWPLGIEWVRLSSSRRELSRRERRVRWLLLAGARDRKPPRGGGGGSGGGGGGGGGGGDSTRISPPASGQLSRAVSMWAQQPPRTGVRQTAEAGLWAEVAGTESVLFPTPGEAAADGGAGRARGAGDLHARRAPTHTAPSHPPTDRATDRRSLA